MNDQILVPEILKHLPAVILVIARISAMVLTMPVIASRLVPARVKAALIIALSLLVSPTIVMSAGNLESSPFTLAFGLVNEALVGALMGLSLSVILAGVQLAGSLMEGLSGFSMSAFGGTPDSETGNGPLTKLFWWTTIAVFIAAGGVGRVVEGMLGSFSVLPIGSVVFDQSFLDFLVLSLGQAFQFGISAALPAVAALLLASVVLGMAQRNFPQLGGMQVGLNIKAIFGMAVSSAALLTAPWMVNGGFELTLDQLQSFIEHVSNGQTVGQSIGQATGQSIEHAVRQAFHG